MNTYPLKVAMIPEIMPNISASLTVARKWREEEVLKVGQETPVTYFRVTEIEHKLQSPVFGA